ESPGLFTGEAGVALAMSVGAPFTSEPEPIIRGALDRLATAAQSVKEADLFIGAAGIILAACIIKEVTGQDDVLSIVRHLPRRLIQSANQFGDVIAWEKEDSEGRSKGVNVGAAHGAAGIALALAHWGHTACDDQAVRLALETFRSIYRGARSRDGKSLKYELTKPNPAPVGAWCHGP